jgi:hypothetical protein
VKILPGCRWGRAPLGEDSIVSAGRLDLTSEFLDFILEVSGNVNLRAMVLLMN